MRNVYLNEMILYDPANDLEHHGVLGMKWGIRRYQPYSLIPRKSGKGGKETAAAKKVGKGKPVISKKAKSKKVSTIKKSRNQKSAEAKQQVEEKAKTARQRQAQLEKIVNSGDAKLVYEHRSELTKKQLDQAIDRINTEARVKSLMAEQNPSTMRKLKNIVKTVDDVNSIARTGINTYRTISDIKKLADDAKTAKTKFEKAEASAAVLKEIIDNGGTAEDIIRLQSKLSKSDLQTAVQRMSSIGAAEKKVHDDKYRDREDRKKDRKYEEENLEYLRKSLSDIEQGGNRFEFNVSTDSSESTSNRANSRPKKQKKRKDNTELKTSSKESSSEQVDAKNSRAKRGSGKNLKYTKKSQGLSLHDRFSNEGAGEMATKEQIDRALARAAARPIRMPRRIKR